VLTCSCMACCVGEN